MARTKFVIKDAGFRRQLRQLERPDRLVRAVAPFLFQEAERVMAISKKLVPVDQGVLRSSGHVQPPKITGSSVRVSMVYGGPAAPYSVVQHERLDYHHNVGQAKYLEQPLLQEQPGIARRLGGEVSSQIRRLIASSSGGR